MVDAARRRPAIRATENCSIPEPGAHARYRVSPGRYRLYPGYFPIAVVTGAVLPLAPALTDGGPRNPQRRMHHGGNRLQHVRGGRITCKRLTADDAVVLDQCRVGAPMGQGG